MTASPGTSEETPESAVVALEVPADVAYVGVVRSLTANLGARCSLTLDEIDDLRIAVDEAFALLVTVAVDGSTLQASFDVAPTALTISVDVTGRDGISLDQGGFGWTVLDALAEITDVRESGPTVGLTMHKQAEEVSPSGTDGTAGR